MKEPEEKKGSEARKAQLERHMKKLDKDIDETTDRDAKVRLIDLYMDLRKEYLTYYND